MPSTSLKKNGPGPGPPHGNLMNPSESTTSTKKKVQLSPIKGSLNSSPTKSEGARSGRSGRSHGTSGNSSSRSGTAGDKRMQKLLYLRQREQMKDALIIQVKKKYFEDHPEALERYNRNRKGKKGGLSSAQDVDALDQIIDSNVEQFCEKQAKLTKGNLNKLLKNVDEDHKLIAGETDKKSHVSEYSHLSQLSQVSAAGSGIHEHSQRIKAVRESGAESGQSGGPGQGPDSTNTNVADDGGPIEIRYNSEGVLIDENNIPITDPEEVERLEKIQTARKQREIDELLNFNWSRLDDYYGRLQEDEERAKLNRVQENKKALQLFLDDQVNVRNARLSNEREEDLAWKYVVAEELEKFKQEDAEKEEHLKYLSLREKIERDEASALKAARLKQEKEAIIEEDIALLKKLQREMVIAEQKEQKKKYEKLEIMKKVKADIEYAKQVKEAEEKENKRLEMERAKAYTKLLLQQEKEKQKEKEDRDRRQKVLIERMKSAVQKAAASKGAEDERRAYLQREEKYQKQEEAENLKIAKLQQMREENRDYIISQMQAKAAQKQEYLEVKAAQGGILIGDAEKFEQDKKDAVIDKKRKGRSYVVELRKQIMDHAQRRVTSMSEQEVRLNKNRIEEVIADEKRRGIYKSGKK